MDIAVKAGDKVLKVDGLLHVDKENDLVILKAKGKELMTAAVNNEDLPL